MFLVIAALITYLSIVKCNLYVAGVNNIAHGERAFKEVGKGYTLNDMKKYGEATYNYLLQLVKIVNSYFSGKMYLAANRI